MAQITITQLPQAQALTGTEAVPVVQNGVTVQTTASAISGAGALNYPFLTVGSTAGLTNARQISAGSGLSLTDNGAGSTLQINLTGAALSLNSSPTGIQVKTGSNTVTGRTLTVNAGLTITNGDGVAGNPTVGLGAVLANVAGITGTGILATASGTFSPVTLTGVSGQISITNGTGSGGNPTFGLSSSGVVAGTYGSGSIVPVFAVDTYGRLTSVTDTAISISASQVTSGTLNIARGGTGAGTATGALTNLLPSQTGYSGRILATDGSTTYWALVAGTGTVTNIATGTGLTGGPITTTGTISIDSTVATLDGTQTFTNKTISGSANTLSNIGNAALTNSSLTVGTTAISLGSSSLTLGGLTSVAVTQDPTSALQLATKQYVDAVAEGLHIHASCAAATPATLASITGGTVTYNNGTAGVGATLTLSVALTTLDGYALTNGDRVLVKNEAAQANNGIYTWATGGTVLTRATDFDTAIEMASGDFTFISNGTLYANTGWVQTNPVTVVGTSPVTWVQFSGAGTYTAGTGLTLTGTQFSLTSPVATNLGGTGLTAFTANGVVYASSTSALSTGSALTYSSSQLAARAADDVSTTQTIRIISNNGLSSLGISYNTILTSGAFYIATGGNLTPPVFTLDSSGSLTITGGLTASLDSSFTSTGALLISKGTTAQQPATPSTGMMRYNSTTNQFEGYSGASPAWKSIGGSALSNDVSTATNLYPVFAGATTGTAENLYTGNANLLYKPSTGEFQARVPVASNGIVVNSLTVATSYTIAAGFSGMSAGPITVASGQSVTVSSGSRWVVL